MNIGKKVFPILSLIVPQIMPAQAVPEVDFTPANLVSGKLANGMHYYIMHNEEPKNRASFYFAQNVGSILEEDHQQGLAHFLEHMAFNGTQNFRDKGMLEYLEKNGIKFGAEINAFTSFDETVYNINQVPVTNKQLMDSVLLVLHDWSGHLSLTDTEIDNERGVIREEWRSRNTAGFRASSKIWLDGLLVNSKYSERMPIGKMDIVNNFKYDELRDYYHRWYRPDQQAVIIVGDIDTGEMENKVKELFSSIPLKPGLPERPEFGLKINKDLIYINSSDRELGDPSVQYYIKRNTPDVSGTERIELETTRSFTQYIVNNRFSELKLNKESPVLNMYLSTQEFVRPLTVMNYVIQPKKDSLLPALQYAMTAYRRFGRFGATPSEIDRARASLRSSLESSLKNRNKRNNDSYAKELYTAFFRGEPVADYAWELNYKLKFLDKITNEDILGFLGAFHGSEGHVIGITGTDQYEYPDKGEIISFLEQAEKEQLHPFEDTVTDETLVDETIKEGNIVSSKDLEGINAKLYTLSNGLQLALFPTDFDKEKIYMQAFSPGGQSLLDEEELPHVFISSYLASQSGLGDTDYITLKKMLAGKQTSVNVSIDGFWETVKGFSVQQDLETLFKRIYLTFTRPRFDRSAFERIKLSMTSNLNSKNNDVSSAFKDSLTMAANGYSTRQILFDQQLIDNVSLEGAASVFASRITNAGDFIFVFVGDFDEKKLLELARKYLGSLPSGEKEQYVDHHMFPQKPMTRIHLKKEMETPQSTVYVSLIGKMPYSREKAMEIYSIGQLLKKKYMDRIREEEGGSYGVSAGASLRTVPVGNYKLTVSFKCNPDKVDKLLAIVYEELDRLSEEVDKEDLAEVKSNLKKNILENQDKNSYWLRKITSSLQNGIPITGKEESIALVNDISPEHIMTVAGKIKENGNIVEGVLQPEDH
ncbi:M16 family metallopeptidase [Sinomicrobium soli]|uniref:M16 family metallopeptidase n=1 Tax=Sinomicrobium sp. N-1-3-6 TaxID=2219864 RepID=UPI000DCDD6DA|nr:insulinase family protein [Sinomicrobium sp. N-1-3-6]RAV29379.1 hypothetical protein DN748_07685 [Sinomicrobium sp. N-1-3-6]